METLFPRILLDSFLVSIVVIAVVDGWTLGIGTGRRHLFSSGRFFRSTKLFKVPKYVISIVPHNDHVGTNFRTYFVILI